MSVDKKSVWEIGNNLEQKNMRDINSRLNEKEEDFRRKYKISYDKLETLYKFSAENKVQELKEELAILAHWENIDTEDVAKIHQNFQEVLNIREEVKQRISSLRNEIINEKIDNSTITEENSILAKYISPKTLQKINDPENIWDEMIATAFTLWESLAWTAKLGKDVIIWAFKAPRDLYQYALKKSTHDWVEI